MLPLIPVVVGVVSAGAATVALLWKRKKGNEDDAKETTKTLPVTVEQTVRKLNTKTATVAELRVAAKAAEAAGELKLARALADHALVLASAEDFAAAMQRRPATAAVGVVPGAAAVVPFPVVPGSSPLSYPSPLDDVTDAAWNMYVGRARVARPHAISPIYRLGMFAFDTRELEDLGIMANAFKGAYEGRAGVWCGEWAPGESLEGFLGVPARQYDAFVTLTKLHARAIHGEHAARIGAVIDGQSATLSGLLGAARKARLGGLRRWLAGDAYPDTTAQYRRFNGIF